MRKAPLLRFTLATLAVACSQAFAAPSPYSTLVVFGDSLSDAGQFPDLTGGTAGMRFTNRDENGNFAPVSPMILGNRLGVGATELGPSTSLGNLASGRPDGNNWAVGGYTTQQILDSITDTSKAIVPPNGPLPGFVFRERPGYLANGLRADPNALYYLTGGGNDFLQGLVNSPADAAAAGSRLAASAQALQQGGARYIMVWLLPDLGQTPNFSGTPQQNPLSQLSGVFNQSLVSQLSKIDAEIIPLNIPVLLNEAIASPTQFGLASGQNLVGTCYSGDSCAENPVYGLNGSTHSRPDQAVVQRLGAPDHRRPATDRRLRLLDHFRPMGVDPPPRNGPRQPACASGRIAQPVADALAGHRPMASIRGHGRSGPGLQRSAQCRQR